MSFASAYAEFTSVLQDLFAAVAAGRTAPLYLFTGQDEFLVSQSARALAHRLIPEEQRLLQLTLAAWDEEGRRALAEFLASRSLFAAPSERGVLMLSDPPTAAGEPELEELLRLLEPGPPSGNVVILIVRQPLPERHPLRQAVSGLGVVVVVPELRTVADRREFIRRRLRHEGLRASAAVVQRLEWMVGNNSRAIAQEARKLALYLYPDNTVKEEHLQLVVSPTTEVRTYELADAIANGEHAKVVALLRRMRETGMEPSKVVNQLSRSLRRMLQARVLLDRNRVDLRALSQGADAFGLWLERESSALAALLPEEPGESLLAQSRYAIYRQFLAAQRTEASVLCQVLEALLHAEVLLKSTTYLLPWDAVAEVTLSAAARVRPPVLDLPA